MVNKFPGVDMRQEFNSNHYRRVRIAREKEGLPNPATEAIASPLIGQSILDLDTRRRYMVENMYKYWYMDGWIIVAEMTPEQEDDADPMRVFWDNINSNAIKDEDLLMHRFQAIKTIRFGRIPMGN